MAELTLDEAVRAADLQLHPLTRHEVGAAARAVSLREELEWPLGDATLDLEFARDYRSQMPHAGTTPEDYLNRWVRVAPDLQALLGPRHRARDRSRPFVAVDAASRRIRPDDLPALRAAAGTAFHRFAPLAVVFWGHGAPGEWPGTTADMRLLAGRAGEVRSRAMPPDLTVAPARDMAFYDRYRAGYAALFDDHPEAREWTRPEEFDALDALRQQHLVLEASVEGRWAGLVAGEPAARGGLRGIAVTEIFLLPPFRGRGFGSALSIALAREARIADSEHVFGTVHWHNVAARAAAAGAGRQDRGGEVVVSLVDSPV